MTVHPLEFPWFYACLIGVMLAWVTFTMAFVLVRPQTPPASDAPKTPAGALAPVEKTRDRRSVIGVLLQSVGYFFMWLSFRPPFPTLSLLPGAPALIVATLAVVLAIASGFLAVWARRTLGREWSFEARLVESHRMVTSGPYAIVRHPIYAAMLGLWIATALAVARPWGIVLGLPFMLAGTWMRVTIEDALLRGAFGEAFEAWARKTPAVVPGLGGIGALLLLALLAGPARGADLADCATKGTWTRYDGEHVILYTNTTPENGLRDAKRFETFAWMMDRSSPTLHKPGEPRIVAIGFASKADYAPFRPTFEGKPVESVGFFLRGPFGKMLQFVSSDRPEDGRVIYHEYVHALTHDVISSVPTWAGEGFADFYSTFEPARDEARFGHPIPGFAWVLQHQEPLSIAQLTGFRAGHEYYQGKRREMFYAESWALVHYLIRKSSMAAFEKAIRALSAGEPPDVVFARAWPSENWSTLPDRLRAYVEPEEMDSFRVPIAEVFVEPKVEMRPVLRAEILDVLGDLLLQEERVAATEAPAYYRAALAVDPQDAAAVRGLAGINQVRKFPKEAEALYQRAAGMPSASAATLGRCSEGIFLLGNIDTTSDETVTLERLGRAGAVALRALAIQADEPRSLGVVAALAGSDSAFAEQAIPALEAAHRSAPRNASVTGGLVRAYAITGSYDAAQALYDTDKDLKADAEEARTAARTLETTGLKLANADLMAGRSKEGRAKLEILRASTRNVEFAAFLDKQIARLSGIQAANQWVDRYNEGIKAVQANKLDQAVGIFEEVRAHSTDERLVIEAARRLEEIRKFRAKTGRWGCCFLIPAR